MTKTLPDIVELAVGLVTAEGPEPVNLRPDAEAVLQSALRDAPATNEALDTLARLALGLARRGGRQAAALLVRVDAYATQLRRDGAGIRPAKSRWTDFAGRPSPVAAAFAPRAGPRLPAKAFIRPLPHPGRRSRRPSESSRKDPES